MGRGAGLAAGDESESDEVAGDGGVVLRREVRDVLEQPVLQSESIRVTRTAIRVTRTAIRVIRTDIRVTRLISESPTGACTAIRVAAHARTH